MDRSDFYYDQEVREAEMDQAFDDVEAMEQNKIIDFDLWGIQDGFNVTANTPADLNIKVWDGVGHDRFGRRIINAAAVLIDLSSYLPTTPGNSRYVDVYGVDYMDESDPRLDGHSNPVNYRLTEGIDFLLVAGTEGVTPAPAAENTDHLPLQRVLLTYGQTQIQSGDLSDGYRTGGEIVWRSDRSVLQDLVFYLSPAKQYEINWVTEINMSSAYKAVGDKGLDADGLSVEDIGFLSMRSGGLDFDMNSNEIIDCQKITFIGSGDALDLNGGEVQDCGDLFFLSGGDIAGDLNQILFSVGASGGIDLNGRDIFCTSGVWTGTDCDRITFDDGLGSSIALQLTDSVIDRCARFYNETGTGTGIDTSGKNIITDGGDLDLSTTGTDGDILGAYNITFGNLLSSSIGSISIGNNVSTGGNIYCDADVFADYDGSGLGGFRYGVGGEKTQFMTLSASEAEAEGATWTYQSGGRDNGTNRRPEWTSSGASIYDLVAFTVHLPKGARIISVKGKVYSQSSGSIEMTLTRYDLNIDSSTTNPGDRSTVPNASTKASTLTTNYETLSDTLSSYHVVSEDYVYEVVFESYAADVHVYGVEIEYDVTTVVAGLH